MVWERWISGGIILICQSLDVSGGLLLSLSFCPHRSQVAAQDGTQPNLLGTLRVAPLFEMLDDLHAGEMKFQGLLSFHLHVGE